jgi:PAS domain S-box-containing protein
MKEPIHGKLTMIDAQRNSALTFKSILNSMATPVTVLDRNFMVRFVNDVTLDVIQQRSEDVIGKYVFDLYPQDTETQTALMDNLQQVLSGKTRSIPAQKYVVEQPDGSMNEYYWRVEHSPFFADDGSVSHIIQSSFNITDAVRADQQRTIISRELDHRVKNMLTKVSAMVTLSGQSAETIDEFRSGLSERVHSIATAHERLAKSNWQGIELREIIELTIDPFCDLNSDKISLEGPPVPLAMKPARDAAMLTHEFISNATKHGFLAHPDGKLKVRWGVEAETELFVLNWIEYGMTGIKAPETEGFGSLISSSFPNMGVTWDFKPDGLNIRVELTPERLILENNDAMG